MRKLLVILSTFALPCLLCGQSIDTEYRYGTLDKMPHCSVRGSFSYAVQPDGTKVLDGPFTVTDYYQNDDERAALAKEGKTFKYTMTGSYSNGKLDGPFKVNMTRKYNQEYTSIAVTEVATFSGSFKNDKPDGKFSCHSSSKGTDYLEVVKFDLSYSDGVYVGAYSGSWEHVSDVLGYRNSSSKGTFNQNGKITGVWTGLDDIGMGVRATFDNGIYYSTDIKKYRDIEKSFALGKITDEELRLNHLIADSVSVYSMISMLPLFNKLDWIAFGVFESVDFEYANELPIIHFIHRPILNDKGFEKYLTETSGSIERYLSLRKGIWNTGTLSRADYAKLCIGPVEWYEDEEVFFFSDQQKLILEQRLKEFLESRVIDLKTKYNFSADSIIEDLKKIFTVDPEIESSRFHDQIDLIYGPDKRYEYLLKDIDNLTSILSYIYLGEKRVILKDIKKGNYHRLFDFDKFVSCKRKMDVEYLRAEDLRFYWALSDGNACFDAEEMALYRKKLDAESSERCQKIFALIDEYTQLREAAERKRIVEIATESYKSIFELLLDKKVKEIIKVRLSAFQVKDDEADDELKANLKSSKGVLPLSSYKVESVRVNSLCGHHEFSRRVLKEVPDLKFDRTKNQEDVDLDIVFYSADGSEEYKITLKMLNGKIDSTTFKF